MGRRLSPEQLDLYNRIGAILWKDWDPIGVSRMGGPRDEYQSYVPQALRLAPEDAPASKSAEYLNDVATQKMELKVPMKNISRHIR